MWHCQATPMSCLGELDVFQWNDPIGMALQGQLTTRLSLRHIIAVGTLTNVLIFTAATGRMSSWLKAGPIPCILTATTYLSCFPFNTQLQSLLAGPPCVQRVHNALTQTRLQLHISTPPVWFLSNTVVAHVRSSFIHDGFPTQQESAI